ncbi:helix-turn-helix domain-containing protein [Pseudoxanthomonas sp. z9]|uniref:AraC family transcriptional regulator n=1 Tax=Pseudoxanthomonas sp. z9 TaxID=2584942 RepID=UPI0015E8A5DB|nr:helix-turn-helix domain-containing protein [Pseudoxanthomonas sp. z9]
MSPDPLDPGKPRGVLRQRLEAGAFQHRRQLPAAALSDWIEHFWQVDWHLEGVSPQQQETLPHPSVHLVIEPAEAGIHGVHTGRYTRWLSGNSYAFGIKFRPGGFQPFLRADVSTLTNRSLPVASILGEAGHAWVDAIRAAVDFQARVALAEQFLAERRPTADPKVAQAAACIARIAADPAIISVEQLVAQGEPGKRALQRLFKHYVGVGPKWIINRYRLHEAVARIQAGVAVDWAQLALELGYFDQAHFIRDFHTLIGMTPGDFARREAVG